MTNTAPHIESAPRQLELPAPMKVPVEPTPTIDENAKPFAGATDLLRILAPEKPSTVRHPCDSDDVEWRDVPREEAVEFGRTMYEDVSR